MDRSPAIAASPWMTARSYAYYDAPDAIITIIFTSLRCRKEGLCCLKSKMRHLRSRRDQKGSLRSLGENHPAPMVSHLSFDSFSSVSRHPHARNLPLPVISLKPISPTIRTAACGVTPIALTIMPADTSGRAMPVPAVSRTPGTPPVFVPSSWRQPIVIFQSNLSGCVQSLGDGHNLVP